MTPPASAPPAPAAPFREPPAPPPPGAGRAAEDRYLRRAFRHHSRTFSLATRLLPRAERVPVAVLYLYCRTVDTLADERALAIGAGRALEEVDGLERALRATLDGRPPGGPHALLWRRLAEVHAAYGLRARPLRQLLDGARWDIEGRAVRTRADLLAYSDLVAGSVGAAMLPFLARSPADLGRLDAPARALGNAMQITNILRDVGEDWRELGRTYLPQDDLDARGLDLGAVVTAAAPPRPYVALIESLMAEAEALYDRGLAEVDGLRPAAQAGIRGAGRMYREILNGVRQNGHDNLGRRAVVPLRRKLRLAVHDDYARRRARLAARAAPTRAGR
ncbi:phytoene/squalene synthase family protein [Rubrivirga sp. S365]|uniref:Phytoene/squalene synthase family protein n=1 Tax=Rubrivirga litoralis TaxID=3075598 RepID=A0ABU3BVG3_9BACT|nr:MULTISPECIES: phytoene/squalene synthase family protein [unclassified Rubrivirga]MDT0633288.1 phytoene/squalene synthase family protein [Rubrivirga sp. F394]MDT7857615.1 phytoene/squalene synthase family protein [Rubrivirga sp. S365]